MSLRTINQGLFDRVIRDEKITETEMRGLERRINRRHVIESDVLGLVPRRIETILQSDIDLYGNIEKCVLGQIPVVVEPGALSYFQNNFKEVRQTFDQNSKNGQYDTAWYGGAVALGLSLIVFPEPASSIAGVGIGLVGFTALMADGVYRWATGNYSYSIFDPTYDLNY